MSLPLLYQTLNVCVCEQLAELAVGTYCLCMYVVTVYWSLVCPIHVSFESICPYDRHSVLSACDPLPLQLFLL